MTRQPPIASVSTIQQRIAEAKKPYRAPKPDRPTCALVIGRNGVAVAVMSDAGPTPERVLQSQEIDPKTGEVYGGVTTEKTMVDGEVRHPQKVRDDIDKMVQKGQITNDEAKIARKFRDEFELAGHDPLKAADPGRQPGGKGGSPGERIQWAKDYVWECLERIGPRGRPGRIAFWWVIGAGYSPHAAALRMGGWMTHKHVTGLVVTALSVLSQPKR